MKGKELATIIIVIFLIIFVGFIALYNIIIFNNTQAHGVSDYTNSYSQSTNNYSHSPDSSLTAITNLIKCKSSFKDCLRSCESYESCEYTGECIIDCVMNRQSCERGVLNVYQRQSSSSDQYTLSISAYLDCKKDFHNDFYSCRNRPNCQEISTCFINRVMDRQSCEQGAIPQSLIG